ncbi:hypothetical protein B0A55_00238 [Friedmanniomyces simplex]|uniref:Rhodopsin domain-containing protein n=1 Tax=Friedmanniomyces simplex TaxID=329884 RepID=A0A4U0Y392_9PEZI|nr:hypothetical protein B0A55_00238 [Friedmanniomyces simplex]
MASTRPDPLPPNTDIGPMMVAIAYAFIFPALITTAFRIWIRARDHVLGYDDVAISLAACLSIVLSALSIEGVRHGKGRHIWYLDDSQTATIGKLSWINQIVLFCAICLIKISVCLLVLRIKNTKGLRYFLYAVMALLVVTTIIPIIALCIECRPIEGFWHRTIGHCHSPDFRIYSIYLQAAYSVLTDLLCSLLPILIVWNLQLALNKKVGVCVVMGMGLVATAFAAVRAASLSTTTTDTTYAYTYTGSWMIIETNLGIIATNLAPMRGVVNLFRRRVVQYSQNRSHMHTLSKSGGGGNPTHDSVYGRRSERDMLADAEARRRPTSSGGGSDQSEIPLKAILQTRTYDVTDHDVHSIQERA